VPPGAARFWGQDLRHHERAPGERLRERQDRRPRRTLAGYDPRPGDHHRDEHELIEAFDELQIGVERIGDGTLYHHTRLRSRTPTAPAPV
jgi:hypothetical protein